MSMINQYYGATNLIGGGTFLNSKAILSVDEGFTYGNTTEYVHVGDFEIDNFYNNGGFKQTLEISASDPINRLKSNNSFTTRTYLSHKTIRDDFNSDDFFNSNWTILNGAWGITAGGGQLIIGLSDANEQIIQLNSSLADFRAVAKGRMTNVTDSLMALDFRLAKEETTSTGGLTRLGYQVRYRSQAGPVAQFLRRTAGGGLTTFASVGISLAANTDYWLMAECYGSQIKTYGSTNGINFFNIGSVTDTTYSSGVFSVSAFSTVGCCVIYDYLDIVNLGYKYTSEDLIRSTLQLSGVNGATFQSDYYGFTGVSWLPSNGSSWVLGSSNNVFNIGTTTGNSFHTYIINGTSLNDFVADFEARGLSQFIGAFVGVTNNFLGNGNFMNFVGGCNILESYIDGSSRVTYNKQGEYVTLGGSIFYKYRVVKSGLFIGFYANGLLINSGYGTSLNTNDATSQSVGFMVYRSGVGGATTEFRNFRISSFDNLVNDFEIQPNDTLYSTFSRLLPPGTGYVYSNGGYEFFRYGASRGAYTFNSNTDYYLNTSDKLLNSGGDDQTIVKGQNNVTGVVQSNNTRKINQADSSRIQFVKDETVQNQSDAINLASTQILLDNVELESLTVRTLPRVTMQPFDQLNFFDTFLGVSSNYRIYSFQKTYNAKTGQFNQDITFSFDQNNL